MVIQNGGGLTTVSITPQKDPVAGSTYCVDVDAPDGFQLRVEFQITQQGGGGESSGQALP